MAIDSKGAAAAQWPVRDANEAPGARKRGFWTRMRRSLEYHLLGPDHFSPYVGRLNLDGIEARFPLPHRQAESCIAGFSGEQEYLRDMLRDLGPGDCFFDVGGYMGLVAVFTGKKLGAGGSVVVFEPDPDLAGVTESNLALNAVGNVALERIALGREPARLQLQTGGASGAAPSFYAKGLGSTVEVPVERLDDVVARLGKSPTHLKIDVEGFEEEVLAGGLSTLANPGLRVVFLELHPPLIFEQGKRWQKPVEILEAAGFETTYIHQKKQETMLTLRRPRS